MLGEKPHVSAAMWLPLLWMMRCGSRSLLYWLNPEAAMSADSNDLLNGNPVDRNFFIVLEVMAFGVLAFRKFDVLNFTKNNKILVLLYIYMLSSFLWSAFPDVSTRRWVRTLGDLLMVLVILSEKDVPAALDWMYRRFVYVLIPVSVFFVKYMREFGVAYDFTGKAEMWVGVTTHKNSLGQLVVIGSIFLFWAFLRKKGRICDIPVFIMGMWLLNGSGTSNSKTSVMVFIMGAALVFTLSRIKNVKIIAITLCSSLTLLFLTEAMLEVFFKTSIFNFVLASTGRDATLTGRTELWEAVIALGMKQPLLGGGYGAFWLGNFSNNLWQVFVWHPTQAHNGYIDIFVDLGIVGLVVVISLIIAAFVSSYKEIMAGSEFGKFRFVLILMVVIYNISESSLIRPTSLLWFTFLLMAVNDPTAKRIREAGGGADVELPFFNEQEEKLT
ncbi:MAG: O-antigen ligase family protein [Chitinispirillales bacterium]|jgi:O-antigen ligase|nr:O-antigen ligase family protein [Chitinispirillales bacterium]